MNNITFEDLAKQVKKYNKDDLDNITKAYNLASKLHDGQKRESGEDYIIHPLNVAYILSLMHADSDTLCAGLLHDTIEDTNITKEEIEKLFNSDVAKLVDGVSKISKLNFSSKEDAEYANTRKIITGVTEDVRIIIIKLADRLHNMRTLEYKTPFKQKENALETLEIYVPFAQYLGGYRIKNELEDLSLQYLRPNQYKEILEHKTKIYKDNEALISEMIQNISNKLNDNNINNELYPKNKNVYSIYRRIMDGQKLDSIHDLLAIKIIVDSINDCYLTLGNVHSLYKPYNSKFKDYICNPKTNLYESLHTTLFAGNRLVQGQIRTKNMDLIASYGLMAYWHTNKGNARNIMQNDLKNKFQFFNSLEQIDSMFDDNKEFVTQVKSELFTDRIYVYDNSGSVIELPKGANIIDYAYKLSSESASNMIYALVNNEYVPFDYVLKNRDRVNIIYDKLVSIDRDNWDDIAQTSYAKTMIKKYIR